MNEQPGIYWIQGLGAGGWRNLQRCADQYDAIARLNSSLTDGQFREARIALARFHKGRVEYSILVETRDGEIVSDALRDVAVRRPAPTTMPPKSAAGHQIPRMAILFGVLVAAIAVGATIANYNPRLAITLFEPVASLAWPDRAKPAAPARVATPQSIQGVAPTVIQMEPSYAGHLFAAVDADDEAEMRRLMAARPGDLKLDEIREFVDDGWGVGPRAIVDYALLGGHIATAKILLSAGATPSDWLRTTVSRKAGLAKLWPTIELLIEFRILPEISVEAAMERAKRNPRGER